jgi:hypothetical protein
VPWNDVKPGGQLSASQLNQLADVANERVVGSDGTPGTRTPGGLILRNNAEETFFARITGSSTSKYSWVESYLDAGTVTFTDLTGGRTGSTTVNYAVSLSLSTSVATSTIVRLTLDPSNVFYTFPDPAGGGGVTGSGTAGHVTLWATSTTLGESTVFVDGSTTGTGAPFFLNLDKITTVLEQPAGIDLGSSNDNVDISGGYSGPGNVIPLTYSLAGPQFWSVTGIDVAHYRVGAFLILYNISGSGNSNSGSTITFMHKSASSSSGNRLVNRSGGNVVVSPGQCIGYLCVSDPFGGVAGGWIQLF